MSASIANINCPFRAPLSQGRALKAYSYRTSGRTETNSLNRWVTPGFIVREYNASEENSGQNHGQQRAHELPLPGDQTHSCLLADSPFFVSPKSFAKNPLESLRQRSFEVMTFGQRMPFPGLIWIDSAPVNGLVRFFQFLMGPKTFTENSLEDLAGTTFR